MHRRKVLALAPHTDDVELGCGASLARLMEEGNEVHVVAFSRAEESLPPGTAPDLLELEFRRSMRVLGVPDANVSVLSFPVRHFPEHRQAILETIVALGRVHSPDLVFTPSSRDLHQDHHVIFAEGLRVFKSVTCLGYELPWNLRDFPTDALFRIEPRHLDAKWASLSEYESQMSLGRPYFNRDFFEGLARVRGTQAGCLFAEAFEVLRLVV